MTARDEILETIRSNRLKVFTPEEIVSLMQQAGTKYQPSTIRTHIISRLCKNAPDNHQPTYPDIERVGRGLYQLIKSD